MKIMSYEIYELNLARKNEFLKKLVAIATHTQKIEIEEVSSLGCKALPIQLTWIANNI